MKYFFRKEILEMFLLFTIVFVISGTFSTIGIDGHHDGIIFKPALDVSRGLVLFRDTFNQYGALTIFIQAFAIYIFGEYLIVVKLVTACFYAITALILWKIWIEFLPKYLVYLIIFLYTFLAAYFIWPFVPAPSVLALFFQLLSVYCLLKFLKNEQMKYLVLSGINTSLTFWCKQPIGVFLFFAIIGCFMFFGVVERQCRDSLNKISYYITGNAIVCFSMILFLLFSDAIKDWWIQSIEFAYVFAQSQGGMALKKIILCLFTDRPEDLVFRIMPLISVLFFIKIILEVIFRRSQLNYENKSLIIIACASLASWLQYYPVASYRHLYWGSIPMIGLVIYCIHNLFIKYNRIFASVMFILIVFLIFDKPVSTRITNGFEKIAFDEYETIKEPRILAGIRVSHEEILFYRELDSYMKEFLERNPSSYIINLTPDALWVTLGGNRKNLHKMYVNWPLMLEFKYPEYQTLVVKNMQNSLFLSNTQQDFRHVVLIKKLMPVYFRVSGYHLRIFRESIAARP